MEHRGWGHLIRVFLLGAALSLGWGLLTCLFRLDQVFSNQAQEKLFSIGFPAQLVLYGCVSPVLEEFLFRYLLHSWLRRRLPERASALITSALFALWHGNVIQILYAFPMGLLFQYLMKEDGSIRSPVCCHMGANLAAVAAQAVMF